MSFSLKRKNRVMQVLLLTFAFMSVPLALLFTLLQIDNSQAIESSVRPTQIPEVAVMNVRSGTHTALLTGHGEVKAQYELTLTSQVEGQVLHVSEALGSGVFVGVQEVLVRVDTKNYVERLENARLNKKQAQLALMQELQEVAKAKVQWQDAKLDVEQTSLLVKREPQLQVAKTQLRFAETQVDKALRDLNNTEITAPFSAMVMQRMVSPGQYIRPGDAVATLYGTERVDVRVSLPLSQWQLLPTPNELIDGTTAFIEDSLGRNWRGVVTEVQQHIDNRTRQRSLVVSVHQPLTHKTPLYPGSFASVVIPGKPFDNLLAIPAASLSKSGDIWYVDENSLLQRFTPNILFQQQDKLFIKNPLTLSSDLALNSSSTSLVILVNPVASLLAGQKVRTRLLPPKQHGGLS